MLTTHWSEILDEKIFTALMEGKVEGQVNEKPDAHVESGLAHIFFYGNTVYKLYKTHADPHHFIKGVFAPTTERTSFLQRDFSLNKHFSDGVYKDMHSVFFDGDRVVVEPYDGHSIHVLYEMDRLDFDTNLHEQLLRSEVSDDHLRLIGYETARLVHECDVVVPEYVDWYQLASERMDFLEQFVEWLPNDLGEAVVTTGSIAAMRNHLMRNEDEYSAIRGDKLTVNLDNHDENIFIIDDTMRVIDLLPPMSCWWYGVPAYNLSNVMANVVALHSEDAAQTVRKGYYEFEHVSEPSSELEAFTLAFSNLISIAHFGSVPEKRDVAERYLRVACDVPGWLS